MVRILDGQFDKSGNGNRLFGAYGSTAAIVPRSTIEPYVFWKRDSNLRTELNTTDNLNLATIGVRWAGKLPRRIDYGTEMAVQTGSLGADNVQAWAGHWQLRAGAPTRVPLGLTGEYNYASGDADPTDGTRGTFDQLYPTGHDKYGLADQVGWRNIHHLRTGVDVTPIKALLLTASYHSWWLAERNDALYNAGGAVIARAVGGAINRHVGQEIDVQASRPITPQLQLSGGYAYIFPGAFLQAGHTRRELWLPVRDGYLCVPGGPMTPRRSDEADVQTQVSEVRGRDLGGLMAGLPAGWVGTAYADDSPETSTMRFGIIALTDCAPIVMAHELGLLQEVRHHLHRLEGGVVGGHPGQAVAR